LQPAAQFALAEQSYIANMSSATVHVKNISHQTSDKEVRDFFSFWYALLADPPSSSQAYSRPTNHTFTVHSGKITNLTVTPISDNPESTKSAAVTFEKDT
jgi:hypothetical protein